MSHDDSTNAYNHAVIEPRWQKFWQDNATFRADDSATGKPKYYVLDMFPYPSAAGLHIGHPEGYTGSDILARYKKARGFNVLHPMGWDAFGLPAEQFAIQTGEHPAVQTGKNIENFRRQLQMLGFGIDWEREISTTDPHYFKWTQWIFLQLFKAGLAYVDEKPVWFCPDLGTVLANEEVLNTPEGPRSERGNFPVERRPIRQWVLRITAYAEKLIAGLDALDWPDSTKRLQKNWIGRSEGAEVIFQIAGGDAASEKLTVYTTRPDTLFGATYMVIAPEHPLVEKLTSPEQRDAVEKYIAQVRNKSDLERTDLAKDKTGVFSGNYAVNPVNGEKIPVWIADYVLMGYGTGAIMAVPAHDQRDWEFAKKFDIPIIPVVNPPAGINADLNKAAFEADGAMINSGAYDGLPVTEAKKKITADLAAKNQGKAAVNYKLRDWLFSRQRYWGEPFPIIWVSPADYAKIPATSPLREFMPSSPVTCKIDGKEVCAVPLPSAQLPLELPQVESYKPSPTGESPLARAKDWVNVVVNLETGEVTPIKNYELKIKNSQTSGTNTSVPNADSSILNSPNDAVGWRETNTMPQWAGSCWYHLRYLDPKNENAIVSSEKEKYWGVPDFYIGGAEHAVLHLLYARFWHRFLYDIGVLAEPEPYKKLFHQGIILGEDGEKMSKSRGNVVNPDVIVKDHGTDALRLYLMFLGPLEAVKPWNTKNIEGISRFLRRVWRLLIDDRSGAVNARIQNLDTEEPSLERLLHQTIKKVTDDVENLRFNTAISQLMIFLNGAEKAEKLSKKTAQAFLQMLAPLAPHIAEELWHRLGGDGSISESGWPSFDESKTIEDTVTIVFQVNGKLRGQAVLPRGVTKEVMLATAKADEHVQKFITGKEIAKEIVVPGKLVNIVVKG